MGGSRRNLESSASDLFGTPWCELGYSMAPKKVMKKPAAMKKAAAPAPAKAAALPKYVKEAGKLPSGWTTKSTKRMSGSRAGQVDVVYRDPDGNRYKSLTAVLAIVEGKKNKTAMKSK